MMPPECHICGSGADDREGLVSFRKRPEDDAWDARMTDTGMTGHPPYQVWFCNRHLANARALERLTVDEALAILRRTE